MMGIGFTEMLVIGVLVLLLFGPDKIPAVAQSLAKIYRELRTTGAEFTRAMRTELDSVTGDTREELRKAQTDLTAAATGLIAGRFGDAPVPEATTQNNANKYTAAGTRMVTTTQAATPPQWLETVDVPYPAPHEPSDTPPA